MKRLFGLLALTLFGVAAQAELVILSDRPEARFESAIQEYSSQTGESVRFIEANYNEIQKQLKSISADLVITKDLVYLTDLKDKGVLKSFSSSQAVNSVPSFMRASGNEWVAITYRARTAVYNPGLIRASELTTYADLADAKWVRSLCVRTSQAAYNEALVGGLILKHSLQETKAILKGWMKNLAAPPMRNDTEVLENISKGNCLVGIVNHYYFAGIKAQNPNFPVEIAFLDQRTDGVLTNGTGVALLKTANNTKNAQAFLELLLTDRHQLTISGAHFDYPAVTRLNPDTLIKDWGRFELSPISWEGIGTQVENARELMSEVGYK